MGGAEVSLDVLMVSAEGLVGVTGADCGSLSDCRRILETQAFSQCASSVLLGWAVITTVFPFAAEVERRRKKTVCAGQCA
jgi:hypothetical protein